MWYKNNKICVKLDRTILAKNGNNEYLLMPHIRKGSYEILGYDWFNLKKGSFNSCMFHPTIHDAIRAYTRTHKIFNADLKVQER